MALDYPEEHRREALLITTVLMLLIGLLCFFVRFNGPNPPLETMGGDGVELNYGLDAAGGGDVQTMATANASPNREDSRPPAATQLQPTPQPAQPRVVASPPAPTEQAKVITSDAEDAGATAPPVAKPTPKLAEPVRETPPAPTPPRAQPRTLYTPKGSAPGAAGGNGVAGTSSTPTGNSNGDHPGTVGDQGDPRGTLNAKALYGEPGSGGSGARPGSGGGSGLEMSGWAVDNVPDIAKIDDTPGVARFRIVINNDGDVVSVTKVSGSISPEQAQAVRNALQKATFRNVNGQDGGATGYYNFRYSVR